MNRSQKWEIMRNPVQLLAVGFGSGFMPKAPGTAGTLAAVPIALLIAALPLLGQCIALALIIGLGCYVCGAAAEFLGVEDPGIVVWDEIAGFCVAMFLVPASAATICLGFLMFRLFDILKPWPISKVERSLSGGVGIMMDDVVAGALTCVILHGIVYFDFL